jgi:hypothetical protein
MRRLTLFNGILPGLFPVRSRRGKGLRWLLIVAGLLVGAKAWAQLPVEVNLFGNDFPKPQAWLNVVQPRPEHPVRPAPDYEQTLLFRNGRQLHGELVAVAEEEVVWHRKDASEPLRFPRAEVLRILLVPPEQLSNPVQRDSVATGPTVKMGGSNWLRAAVKSRDRETVVLALNEQASVTLPRDQIEWLSFDAKFAPAMGFDAGTLALTGWAGKPRLVSRDGTLFIRDARWIGHEVELPARFEVDFEVPAEGEEGLRLIFQPSGAGPGLCTSGAVQIEFGRKALTWLVTPDEPREVALPAEAQAETGAVCYRVLYDGVSRRVIILRNGREVGDRPVQPSVELPLLPGQNRLPRSFGLERGEMGADERAGLQFRWFSIAPWDGVRPAAKAAGPQDEAGATPPDASSEGEIPMKFPRTSTPLTGGETILSFGGEGELTVAELRASEGGVRGRAAFAPAMEVPASALQSISFVPAEARPLGSGDVLVFKNGDEIPGKLVATATGAPLRWRMSSGKETDFGTEQIAGVRLANAARLQPAATIELRTGERWRGEIASFDEHQLRWRHALLGELTIARADLWRLYPNLTRPLTDGSQDAATWLHDRSDFLPIAHNAQMPRRSTSWNALDGRFILRRQDSGDWEDFPGPSCQVAAGLERFELSVDVAFPFVCQGSFHVVLLGASEQAFLQLRLSEFALDVAGKSERVPADRFERHLRIWNKLGGDTRTLRLRVFVDRSAGTADFFINGLPIGRTGDAEAERLPGIGRVISTDAYVCGRSQMLLSQITITPWSGARPRPGMSPAVTNLTNGDAATGAPLSLTGGVWKFGNATGAPDVPVERVQSIEFGGEMRPAQAAGRLRLVDGSSLLVDRFEWKGGEWSAHHALCGEIRVPASAASELIFNPSPMLAPVVLDPKEAERRNKAPGRHSDFAF